MIKQGLIENWEMFKLNGTIREPVMIREVYLLQ